MKNVQIILAGIGGQGILFSSRLIAEWGLRSGLDIMGSETHGMSQRGGSVTAHLKLGSFRSPVIREETADILYSFEENETYKSLKFIKSGGICFANLENENRFDRKVLDLLEQKEITFRTFDASGTALKIGSVMSANIILIGYSVGTGLVPFEYDDLKTVLESITKKAHLETNLKAFEIGYKAGRG
ncbi:MAG: 2-oxoacid:acceptor oxidoreductase family protein [bacterium]|nr:MAG: 2-oxoacid:acceptor oxidoreductase family protein [bacterium]